MTQDSSRTAFVEQAYRDAYDLLVAVRDYVAQYSGEDAETMAPDDRLKLTYELSLVTRQLTGVMAWLMLQKAVIAGEVTAEQAASDPAAEIDAALPEEGEADPQAMLRLPVAARGLIDRSRRLVAHVSGLARR